MCIPRSSPLRLCRSRFSACHSTSRYQCRLFHASRPSQYAPHNVSDVEIAALAREHQHPLSLADLVKYDCALQQLAATSWSSGCARPHGLTLYIHACRRHMANIRLASLLDMEDHRYLKSLCFHRLTSPYPFFLFGLQDGFKPYEICHTSSSPIPTSLASTTTTYTRYLFSCRIGMRQVKGGRFQLPRTK
jgi:hypothetical protein